jgi:hypothetical protein
MTLVEILQGANVALHLLQVRLVLVLTLLLTFAMFAWAMVLQTQLGCILAAAWAALVFLPVLYTGGRRHGEAQRRHIEDESSQPAKPVAIGSAGR